MRSRTSAAAAVALAAVAVTAFASPALAGKSGPGKSSKPSRTTTTTVVTSPTATATTATPTATATPTPVVEPVTTPVVEPVVATASASSEPAPAAAPAMTTLDAQALPLLQRPTLVNPITVTLTQAVPVLTLLPDRDYIVQVSNVIPFTTGAAIVGGRNVVLENAALRYDERLVTNIDWLARGLFLKAQTGVMWVNHLEIRGPLKEGIQLDQKAPGAAVVLQNIAIDPVSGTYDAWHADLLQTWAGPAKLVVDNFTGTSDYQGMFLKPNQLWADGPKPEFFWLRNVHMDVSTGNYALWTDGFGAFPVQTTNVTVKAKSTNRDAWLWPKPSTGDTTWSEVVGLF